MSKQGTKVFVVFFFWGGGGGRVGGGDKDRVLKGILFVCLFVCFTSQVNSYGHCGTVSSPNHTFFLGKLEQAVNQ